MGGERAVSLTEDLPHRDCGPWSRHGRDGFIFAQYDGTPILPVPCLAKDQHLARLYVNNPVLRNPGARIHRALHPAVERQRRIGHFNYQNRLISPRVPVVAKRLTTRNHGEIRLGQITVRVPTSSHRSHSPASTIRSYSDRVKRFRRYSSITRGITGSAAIISDCTEFRTYSPTCTFQRLIHRNSVSSPHS